MAAFTFTDASFNAQERLNYWMVKEFLNLLIGVFFFDTDGKNMIPFDSGF